MKKDLLAIKQRKEDSLKEAEKEQEKEGTYNTCLCPHTDPSSLSLWATMAYSLDYFTTSLSRKKQLN